MVFEVAPNAQNQLTFSTYLGGSNPIGIPVDEFPFDVSVAGNEITVCGRTTSSNFPVTANAYDPTWSGAARDGFVTRIDTTGSTWVYSTFFGGVNQGFTEARTMHVDGNGVITFGGMNSAPKLPVPPSGTPYQPTLSTGCTRGCEDGFLA